MSNSTFENQRQARLDSQLFLAIDEENLSSLRNALSNGANPNATRKTSGGSETAILAAVNGKSLEISRQLAKELRSAGADPLDFSTLRVSIDSAVSDESVLEFAREFEKIKTSSNAPR